LKTLIIKGGTAATTVTAFFNGTLATANFHGTYTCGEPHENTCPSKLIVLASTAHMNPTFVPANLINTTESYTDVGAITRAFGKAEERSIYRRPPDHSHTLIVVLVTESIVVTALLLLLCLYAEHERKEGPWKTSTQPAPSTTSSP
jgi:hypothetical protein